MPPTAADIPWDRLKVRKVKTHRVEYPHQADSTYEVRLLSEDGRAAQLLGYVHKTVWSNVGIRGGGATEWTGQAAAYLTPPNRGAFTLSEETRKRAVANLYKQVVGWEMSKLLKKAQAQGA